MKTNALIVALLLLAVGGVESPSPTPTPTPTPTPDVPDDGARADFNQDGVVNQSDVDTFLLHYGTARGDALYSEGFDFDHNGVIDSRDYSQLSTWVEHWNYYHSTLSSLPNFADMTLFKSSAGRWLWF